MSELNYICKIPVPCTLSAWNNYAGYTKYDTILPNHKDTLEYFLTLVPPSYSTITIQSHNFHIFVPWIDSIMCDALFVVKGKHIYIIKRIGGEWIQLDYPRRQSYKTIMNVSMNLQDTQYIVVLFPSSHLSVFKRCVRLWIPKRIPYYTEFKTKLLQSIAD